ncbi:hypothetical protein [Kribbella endophytica]
MKRRSKDREPEPEILTVHIPKAVPIPDLPDAGTFLDLVEQMARTDAASGMYRDAFLASHGRQLVGEVRLTEQLARAQRDVAAHRAESRTIARKLIRERVGDARREEHASANGRDELDEAERSVAEQGAVLRGDAVGVDEGNWTDSTALTHPGSVHAARWRDRGGSALFYLVFGGAELYFSYLALKLIGENLLHTWMMAVVVGAAVLFLPKYAGREAAFFRATRQRRHLAVLAGLVVLLGVVLVGLADLRTKYVFAPTTTPGGKVTPKLATTAGLDSAQLMILWLAVSMGIAAIVLVYSALRTNPHRDAYRRALIRLTKVRAQVVEQEEKRADAVSQYDDRVTDAAETDAMWARFDAGHFERLAPEAIASYRQHLARAFADPDITTALEVGLPNRDPEDLSLPASRP